MSIELFNKRCKMYKPLCCTFNNYNMPNIYQYGKNNKYIENCFFLIRKNYKYKNIYNIIVGCIYHDLDNDGWGTDDLGYGYEELKIITCNHLYDVINNLNDAIYHYCINLHGSYQYCDIITDEFGNRTCTIRNITIMKNCKTINKLLCEFYMDYENNL